MRPARPNQEVHGSLKRPSPVIRQTGPRRQAIQAPPRRRRRRGSFGSIPMIACYVCTYTYIHTYIHMYIESRGWQGWSARGAWLARAPPRPSALRDRDKAKSWLAGQPSNWNATGDLPVLRIWTPLYAGWAGLEHFGSPPAATSGGISSRLHVRVGLLVFFVVVEGGRWNEGGGKR